MSVLFIGGGNMAQALMGGMVAHGQDVRDMVVVEIDEVTAQAVAARWAIRVVPHIPVDLKEISTVVLAVKPQQLVAVLQAMPPLEAQQLVISIVAGWTTTRLSQALGGHVNLVRAMPNTPALVRAGTTGLFAMDGVSEDDRLNAQALLQAVGAVHWLPEESLMDVVTALSGSGPAYVFLLMEAMQAIAIELGLETSMARAMALETVRGAAQLACSGDVAPQILRERVTSPGGTTEAALGVLQTEQWVAILQRAVRAAAQRSAELAHPLPGESQ
jgi:pyrroline-5-carboxylate reductase